MLIDSHLHLWPARLGRYHWRRADARLDLPCLPQRLRLEAPGLALNGAIHVEAGYDNDNPGAELHWLKGLRTSTGLPTAVVAGAELRDQGTLDELAELGARGVRHIVEDAAWLQDPNWRLGFARLGELGLGFDAQLPPGDWPALKALAELCDAHPSTRVILNHGGFAPLADQGQWHHWQQAMAALAARPQVAVKLSGLAMMKPDWSLDDGRRLLDALLALFGDARVMLGSNFPVEPGRYGDIWQRLLALVATQPEVSRQRLLAGNARHWYRLP
ncbi:amidohydrolase family protein [Gallaecimonas sp. GXIMD4217]|uniref:amidohydrolase family protein n=1 Tax=Gallaecimonas sp. GXIMD4217 TaxID=3131927 RepID=UPI00311B0528